MPVPETLSDPARPRRAWPPSTCWVMTDGNAGTENQALGLAEALGLSPQIKRLRLSRTLRELGIFSALARQAAFARNGIEPPWPDLVISTGRAGAIGSAHIKRVSRGRTFAVQIQVPVVPARHFDRIVVPTHDRYSGRNVIEMIGALHRITPALLQREAARWAPRFAHLPRPYVTVLLGGSKTAVSPLRRLSSYRLGRDEISAIAQHLRRIAADGRAGLLITASRRTSEASIAQIKEEMRGSPATVWDGSGDNPYYGMLGLADAFLVTCDSVNMICEACSTGKPVHMIELPGYSSKMSAFHEALMSRGQLRKFNGALEQWHYEPLHEKERVAALVRDAYTGIA